MKTKICSPPLCKDTLDLKELHIVENRVQTMANIYTKDPKTTICL